MRAPDWLTARPVAHRGLHNAARGIIENMPAATEGAISGNFAIECDIQLTSDGEAMVHHDDELGRLTDVAVGADGRIFIADTDNDCVRVITPDGNIATFAGQCGQAGFAGENGPAFARLREELQAYTATPTGVGLDVPFWLRRLELEVHRVEATRTTIAVLAEKVASGLTLTLLCSSACTDGEHCHRFLLKQLIEAKVVQIGAPA